MTSTLELLKKVKLVWSKIEAAPIEDMRYLSSIGGEESVKEFTGVKPVDVDIDSLGFEVAEPLLDLPGRAAAAYLGTYLISLLDGIDLEEKAGFPTDISTRVHTLVTLTSSRFWSHIAKPYLTSDCLQVVCEIADLLLTKREMLVLRKDNIKRLELLIGLIKKELGHEVNGL